MFINYGKIYKEITIDVEDNSDYKIILVKDGQEIDCKNGDIINTPGVYMLTVIDDANNLKSAAQEKAERLADKLVPYNFLLAGSTYLVTRDIIKTSSTLMVDYSCAMKLAAPIANLSAMKEAAKYGIIVKGGKFLEETANADTIIFDKTGTLTNASPKVINIIAFNNYSTEEVLKTAACF